MSLVIDPWRQALQNVTPRDTKRYRRGSKCKRAVMDPISIDDLPAIVNKWEHFSNREVDTVMGRHSSGALGMLTQVQQPPVPCLQD